MRADSLNLVKFRLCACQLKYWHRQFDIETGGSGVLMIRYRSYRQAVYCAQAVAAAFATILLCLLSLLAPAAAEEQNASPARDNELSGGSLKFMITFTKGINSKAAAEGQEVEGSLQDALKLDNRVIAPAGSAIFGHIEQFNPSRTLVESAISSKKRFRMRSSLIIRFDRIVKPDKQELNIAAQACRQFSLFSNGHTVREIIVGPEGELLKTGDMTMIKNEDLGLAIPKSWVNVSGHFQIDIQPGDQLTVEASEPYGMLVSAKVLQVKQEGKH